MLDLVAAAALLLWGLRMVRTGVNRAFGVRLHHALALGTRDRASAFLTGLVATLALQSSTATAIMTASFAGGGLITTSMALAILLGADVGTSLVAKALAFDIHWLSSLLILTGVAIFMARDTSRSRAIGRALIGLGLMLLALDLLSQSVSPLRQSPVLINLIQVLDAAPILAMVVAALLTLLASSSLAIVLFVMSLTMHGTLTPGLAVTLVLGANLGATILPILATAGGGPLARRAPFGNMTIRASGCLIALPFAGPIAGFVHDLTGDPARLVIDTHLLFNLVLAGVFLPLVGLIAPLLDRLLPETPNEKGGPRYLDRACLDSPPVALACAARETMHLGDKVQAMLQQSLEALQKNDAKLCAAISRLDDEVDSLQEAIKLYLAELGRDEDLDSEDAHRAGEIVSFAINLEHIGDIVDKNLRELVAKKIKRHLAFSDEGLKEITDFYARTLENLRIAQSTFLARDAGLARQLVDLKVDIRNFEKRSSENHFARIKQGRIESVRTSSLHLDIMRDLKRINAHIASVAYPILDELGVLAESRVHAITDRSKE